MCQSQEKSGCLRLKPMFGKATWTDTTFTTYFERFKNLVSVIYQHKANIGKHDALIKKELAVITGTAYDENFNYTAAQ